MAVITAIKMINHQKKHYLLKTLLIKMAIIVDLQLITTIILARLQTLVIIIKPCQFCVLICPQYR